MEKTKQFEIITPEEEMWAQAVDDVDEKEESAFKIDGPKIADWAFKKIKAAKEKVKEREEFAKEEKKKIDEWLQKENQEEESSIVFFESHLIRYFQELRAQDPKAKLTTPNGRVSSRKRQPTWKFDDEKTVEYLKRAAPDEVEEVVEYKYNKTQVKKMFTPIEIEGELKVVDQNGEFIDIATVTENEPSYTVKVED